MSLKTEKSFRERANTGRCKLETESTLGTYQILSCVCTPPGCLSLTTARHRALSILELAQEGPSYDFMKGVFKNGI